MLIAWIDTSTWQKVVQLERDFTTIRTERFYQSVRLRMEVRQLNDTLFRFHLKGHPEDLESFRRKAGELGSWIRARAADVPTGEERTVFLDLESAYAAYLRETAGLQKRHVLGFARKQLDEINEKLRVFSKPVLDLSEHLMEVQGRAFTTFLEESGRTLDSFQQLIKISLVLLVVLAVSLVVLVYRGMIAPLRVELSISRAAAARQEKLAALGALAAGVAHEIRNPLTAIKFRLFSLKKSLPAALGDNEDAAVIGSEINRLESIVKGFLLFARPADPKLIDLPASRILAEVQDLLRPPLERVAIQLHLDGESGVWLHADPQQIKQVLINLVQNAAESIGRDGSITLHVTADESRLAGVEQPVVVIGVTDTGHGITPEVQERLFDPFFTTKEGGTGLGLPIAARIVEKHGGELRYETHPDKGTTFQLVLPRAARHES